MAKKRKLKYQEKPLYPSDYQAKQYAKQQKAQNAKGADCKTSYIKTDFSPTVTALASWGCKNIYFVYAYPAEGVTTAFPEEILGIQLLEGWIFQNIPGTDVFNLLVKASRDGEAFFKSERNRHKKS